VKLACARPRQNLHLSLSAFTVGDQLLWGAAEPLRRMLGILKERGVS
jgi:aspartate-semialdehyde dehydrogenase